MKVTDSHLKDCKIIEFDSFVDQRGVFYETFNEKEFERMKLPLEWAQDNLSESRSQVLRGLHLQTKNPQGKLVRCIKGEILDVAMDLRPDSPTFKEWHMVKLTHQNRKAFWVPPGFAHGFFSVTDSIVYYKCTTLYDKESDGGINPLSVKEIPWPSRKCIMSEKDKNLPKVDEWVRKHYGIKE